MQPIPAIATPKHFPEEITWRHDRLRSYFNDDGGAMMKILRRPSDCRLLTELRGLLTETLNCRL